MKIPFSGQIFEKCSNIKFLKNDSGESRAVPCGQTDRHETANSGFSQFYEGQSLKSEINLEKFKGKSFGADSRNVSIKVLYSS
jgi:hypothetical protein